MNTSKQPARMGRPPRFPEEGARIGHSLRLKPSTDKALREAAEKNNRSLAEEMEHRLEITFRLQGGTWNNIDLSIDGHTRSLKKEIDFLKNRAQSEQYSSRLSIAIERRYSLTLERIVFEHQIRISTRLFGFLGNRFQKFVNFGRDAALERVSSINSRIKEQDGEIDDCRRMMSYYRKMAGEDIKRMVADAADTVFGADGVSLDTNLYTGTVDELGTSSDLTAARSRASAPPRPGRAAVRR